MAVQAVSHIAIGVRDMDVALGFYRDVVGLRITADKVEEFAQADGGEPARRRAVYLRWRDGAHESFIVLDQQLTYETTGAPTELFQMGCHHFAFWVDDLEEIMGRVRAQGITVVLGDTGGPGADSTMYGEPPGGRIKSAIVRDPEGNYVQFDQRA
jgi:catechol 2,3-dioxygenase-like lactoylglutathione lyase family enzyme